MSTLANLIAVTIADSSIEAPEVANLRLEVFEDTVIDFDEIKAIFVMAADSAVTDDSDGELQALMRDMMLCRYLGDDGEITDYEMDEITDLFAAADATPESQRQILYVVREAAIAICPAFEIFCAERGALEL